MKSTLKNNSQVARKRNIYTKKKKFTTRRPNNNSYVCQVHNTLVNSGKGIFKSLLKYFDKKFKTNVCNNGLQNKKNNQLQNL